MFTRQAEKIALLVWIAIIAGKADIDMPAGIGGIIRMRKAYRKRAEIIARPPAPAAHDLIEGGMQHRRVDGEPEGLIAVPAEPYHGPRPGRGIICFAGQVAPQDGAALVGELPGKGFVDADKTVLDELLDLRGAECARLFAVTGHGILEIAYADRRRPREAATTGSFSCDCERGSHRLQRLREKTETIFEVFIIICAKYRPRSPPSNVTAISAACPDMAVAVSLSRLPRIA